MNKPILSLVYLYLLFPLFLQAQGTRLLRQPTISQKQIVFVYADDLWVVDRDGGDARRLTNHEGTESFPHFSFFLSASNKTIDLGPVQLQGSLAIPRADPCPQTFG